MRYADQFYIGKVPVWIAEVEGVPLWKTNHKRNYLFPRVIQNLDHAQQLLDHFSLVSIDLREDYRYRVFAGNGIAVDSMLHRRYDHSVYKPPTFPRELLGPNLFVYLCDAESALNGLQLHFQYMVERIRNVPAKVRGELSNILQPQCVNETEMNRLRIGLNEKPRRKTSLTTWMSENQDSD